METIELEIGLVFMLSAVMKREVGERSDLKRATRKMKSSRVFVPYVEVRNAATPDMKGFLVPVSTPGSPPSTTITRQSLQIKVRDALDDLPIFITSKEGGYPRTFKHGDVVLYHIYVHGHSRTPH